MSIGIHVSKSTARGRGKKIARDMPTALREDIEYVRAFGITRPCAQIFVSGPRNFTETLNDDEKDAIKNYIAETNTRLVIHGAYVDNPWNRSAGSIHNIKQEMCTAARIGATGVIVHLGAAAANNENLHYVLGEIAKLPQEVKSAATLWLEIHAAKSSANTYETPAKIRRLFERVAEVDHGLKIGLCIDSAHVFSCGVALSSYEKTYKWLDELPNVPIMIHLNDSASTLGSGVDEHEFLTGGNIWNQYNMDHGHLPIEESGIIALLDWATLNDSVVILERDEDGAIRDLTLIGQLGYFR